MKAWAWAAAVLLATGESGASRIGESFGATLSPLISARQAGTGGVALEDPWRQGTLLDASVIELEAGVRWFGLRHQGGLGSGLRALGELYRFEARDLPRTLELADGTYGGEQGSFDATETGGRATLQATVLKAGSHRVAALGRISGIVQSIPGARHAGLGAEAGVQSLSSIDRRSALAAWAYLGPVGRGARHAMAGELTVGGELLSVKKRGVVAEREGFGAGGELRLLREGPLHGSLATVYWFGRPSEPGMTLFLRGGLKIAQASAQPYQPRAGAGWLWRRPTEWGVQVDYAFVPLGDLGAYHYLTIGTRIPPARSWFLADAVKAIAEEMAKPVQPIPEPAVAPPPPPSAPSLEPGRRAERVEFFYPDEGEILNLDFILDEAATVSAGVYGLDGTLVRTIVEERRLEPGPVAVRWDGTDARGGPVGYGRKYVVQIRVADRVRQAMVIPAGR